MLAMNTTWLSMPKIEKLQSKIEVYSALADFYWAQIQEAIGSSTAEPVVE